ncbi:MAG: ATP-dependent Clp protease proteolytic subunit, partial [Candidatus Paceibacterota bacterium]
MVIGLLIIMAAAISNAQEIVKLGTANTVNFRGVVNDEMAQGAALELLRLNKLRGDKDYPIYIVMDTPGGNIDSGEAFIEIAKSIPNVKTITLFAASMGSAVVEALPGERLILDSGILMFHRAKGQVGGQFETGELESR